MANNENNVTINIKAVFDKSNMGDFQAEVKNAIEEVAKQVKSIEIKANTQPARRSMQDFTSYLTKLSNAKDGFTTIKIHANTDDAIKSINGLKTALVELNKEAKFFSKNFVIPKLKLNVDSGNLLKQVNKATGTVNKEESLKNVKLGVDTSNMLKDINKAIVSINSNDSLKKLKLGIDSNYLQTQLNKAVKGLDATVKLKTKLEASSKKSETKGTVTRTRTSKDDANEYKSLFSKRAATVQELDKAYQEFGRNSKEVSAALREFAAASKAVRQFGKDTGVLSLDKIASDIKRQMGAGLTSDFTKNWLKLEYDKVQKEKVALDRNINPAKYERLDAVAKFKQLQAEHAEVDAEIKQKKQELTNAIADATKYYRGLRAEKADTAATNKQIADYVNKGFAEHEAWLKQDAANAQLLEQATANRQKMEHEIAKLKFKQLQAEHADDDATRKQKLLYKKELNAKIAELAKDEVTHQKSVNTALDENLRKSKELERTEKERLKTQDALNKALAKQSLLDLAKSAKEDKVFDKDKAGRFFEQLQAYRDLMQDYRASFFTNIGRELRIDNEHPYFAGMKTAFTSARKKEQEWYKNPITTDIEVKGSEKLEEVKQKTLTVTQQFMRLRGEALKAGNALNKATDPKDIERLKLEFQKAIQALVNYQRATRGLTKGGEASLVEKLAVGSIKEKTEAYKVLYEWIKKAVQAQRDLDVGVGRRLPPKSKDTDLMSWFKNIDIGQTVAGMAYADRGILNTIQSFGNLISSLSQVSGVVGIFAKVLGGVTVVGLGAYAALNSVSSAFNYLVGTLNQVFNTIYSLLRPGVELYKQRQTAELAVAAAISSRATENGQPISFDRANEISSALMQRVIIDAAKSAFNPQELIDALRGTLPLAFGKGLNLEQAYELTKGAASVAKVINLAPNQVLQELRDILQGTISARSSQVAGATGITGEELREAEEQGKLYEYISEHLKNFTFALNKYANTLAGALDRLSETYAIAMETVFQKLAPIFNKLLNEFIDNYIGWYVDAKTGEKIDTTNSDNLKNSETGEYRQLKFEPGDMIKNFQEALVDLVEFLAPIIDEILDFVSELTGELDPIKAVAKAIKYAIRVTVTLGEFILKSAKAVAQVLDTLEIPIAWVIGNFINLGAAGMNLAEALWNTIVVISDSIMLLKKAFTGEVSTNDILNSAKLWEKTGDSFFATLKSLKDSFTTFSYDELFGVNTEYSKNRKGKVTQIIDDLLAKYRKDELPKDKNVDYNAVQGMAKENKENLADLRKAMQAAIEDIKQALKEALAELKDLAEKNDLAYRQGYKSIEDYFNQKAEIELKEAELKLQAAIDERDLIEKLDVGEDKSAQYQRDRDLIRINGDIKSLTRDRNKKLDQQLGVANRTNEILNRIEYKLPLAFRAAERSARAGSGAAVPSNAAITSSGGGLNSALVNVLNDWEFPLDVAKKIVAEATKQGVDPLLALAVAKQESNGDQSVFSTDEDGNILAKGIMQITEEARQHLEGVLEHTIDVDDELQNIEAGIAELKQGLEINNGDVIKALVAYNAGQGRVEEYGGIPPFNETQQYVKDIWTGGGDRAGDVPWYEQLKNALGSANVTEAVYGVQQGIETVFNDVEEALESDLNANWLNAQMNHARLGCIEFGVRFMGQFSSFFAELAKDVEKYVGIDEVWEKAKDANIAIENITEEAIRNLKAGDVIFINDQDHTNVIVGRTANGFKIAANSSGSYEESHGLGSGDTSTIGFEQHTGFQHIFIEEKTISDLLEEVSGIVKSSETLGNSFNIVTQSLNEAQQRIADTNVLTRQAMSQVEEQQRRDYLQGHQEWMQVEKEYAKLINDPANLLENTLKDIDFNMSEKIRVAKNKFGNAFPRLAGVLELLFPAKEITAAVESIEYSANMRLKMMEHDAKAINRLLHDKFVNFPQAIEKYYSYFFGTESKYNIVGQINDLLKYAEKAKKGGFTGLFTDIIAKIEGLQQKFYDMVESWITEMSSYFDFERQMIDADSGLTNFVKEERKNQLSKGEYRVKAQAYRDLSDKSNGQAAYWLFRLNQAREEGNEIEGSIAQQMYQREDQLTTLYDRQARLNEQLGEYKTLWQETMDATNQALENGLYKFMTETINTTESIGEAFRQLAVDILSDLQKFFAKKAITDFMHMIVGKPNLEYFAPNAVDTIIGSQNPIEEAQRQANEQLQVSVANQSLGIDNQILMESQRQTYYFTNILGVLYDIDTILKSSQFTSAANGTSSSVSQVFSNTVSPSYGSMIKRAEGGIVIGAGTSTSDSIPAMLSNGEYVVNAESVRRYGTNFLDAVNSGAFTRVRHSIPHFAEGGVVGDALQDTARGMTDFAKNIGTNVSTTNNMNVALVRNEQEAYEHFLRSPAGQRILVDFQRGNGRVFARFNS